MIIQTFQFMSFFLTKNSFDKNASKKGKILDENWTSYKRMRVFGIHEWKWLLIRASTFLNTRRLVFSTFFLFLPIFRFELFFFLFKNDNLARKMFGITQAKLCLNVNLPTHQCLLRHRLHRHLHHLHSQPRYQGQGNTEGGWACDFK